MNVIYVNMLAVTRTAESSGPMICLVHYCRTAHFAVCSRGGASLTDFFFNH